MAASPLSVAAVCRDGVALVSLHFGLEELDDDDYAVGDSIAAAAAAADNDDAAKITTSDNINVAKLDDKSSHHTADVVKEKEWKWYNGDIGKYYDKLEQDEHSKRDPHRMQFIDVSVPSTQHLSIMNWSGRRYMSSSWASLHRLRTMCPPRQINFVYLMLAVD